MTHGPLMRAKPDSVDAAVVEECTARWACLCHVAGVGQAAPRLLATLLSAYLEPQRHYHNLRHVLDCLRVFEPLADRAESPTALEFSIWFHDVIYAPQRGDNEQKSAELAVQLLTEAGAPADLVRRVTPLILATRHTSIPEGPDERLLVDIDLSILGQTSRDFDLYESAVREEYAWVPDAIFWAKRSEILEGFLDRPRLYHTPEIANQYEARARQNLQRAILSARLRANAPVKGPDTTGSSRP